ncbi:MAG: hypothetical protein SVR94_15010 [Pseudomonadota bacterium]|nr:hypothetical protein [Pseudomonadota bacterium]
MDKRLLWNGVMFACCLVLALMHGLLLYGASSGRDDVYITYWAAYALSHFGSIVNYNGEPLEQSSSLLHVLLLALLKRLVDIPLPTLGPLFSSIIGGLTLLATWRLAVFLAIPSAGFVALFCALFPYLVYWSFSGLETSLVALIVLGLMYTVSQFLTQKLSIGLFFLTVFIILAYLLVRPEAVFMTLSFIILMGFFLSISARSFKNAYVSKLSLLFVITVLLFIVLSAWRYYAWGQIFPQPVYAKTDTGQLNNIFFGIQYLVDHFWLPSLGLLMVLSVLSWRNVSNYAYQAPKRIAFITLFSWVLVTLMFTVAVGGDWMEGGRFLVPIIPLLLLLGLFDIPLAQQHRKILLVALAFMATLDTARFVREYSIGIPFLLAEPVYKPVFEDLNIAETQFSWFEKANHEHLRDIPLVFILEPLVSRLLAVEPKPMVIASGQMGMVAFYLAQKHFAALEFIDMKGLTTTHFLRCPLTHSLSTSRFGLQLSYAELFENAYTQCIAKRPALIYDLGGTRRTKMIARYGYQVVYAQIGIILTGDDWTRKKVWAGQYVAIRQDLVNKIKLPQPKHYRWPEVR